jgi:hypothetical protein
MVREVTLMKHATLCLILLASTAAFAGDKPVNYQRGTLLEMNSVECGFEEKSGKSMMGQILGTDGAHKNTKATLCQEYVLQADRVIYRIRPRDEKKPVLLPVGETAQFRIKKEKLILRVPEGDDKEREYSVVSMTQRAGNEQQKDALKEVAAK